jgi:hypothetical protein
MAEPCKTNLVAWIGRGPGVVVAWPSQIKCMPVLWGIVWADDAGAWGNGRLQCVFAGIYSHF